MFLFNNLNEYKTFLLTTGTDTIDGTDGDDTITGAAGTLQATDVIADTSTTDNDTLNLTLAAAGPAATISKIENINVTIDALDGNNAALDADNIFGSTITVVKGAVVNGVAVVNNSDTNDLVVGSGITNFTASHLSNGVSVDLGAATDATLDAEVGGTEDVTLTVNGDIDLVLGATRALDQVTLNVTAAASVDLDVTTRTGDVAVEGAGDLTITGAEMLDSDAITSTSTGTVVAQIDAAGAVNATDWDVAKVVANVDMNNNALTVSSGATVEAAKAQTSMEIAAGTALTKDVVTLNTGVNHTTDLTFTGFEEVTVNATANTIIDDLVVGDKVILTGAASKVTISETNADELDASAFAGTLSVTETNDTLASIKAGTGKGTFVIGDLDVSFTGNTNVDTVDARAIDTATTQLTASLGAGDDVVKIGDAATAGGTLVMEGGAGTDTLWLENSTGATNGHSIDLFNFEKVEVENVTVNAVDAATAVDLSGSVLSGLTLEVLTAEAADTVTVTVTADEATTDLSGISQTNIDTFEIDGRGTAGDSIIGTKGADVIDTGNAGNAAAMTLTGGAGKDTFIFVAGDSEEGAVSSITDYTAGEDKLDIDVIALAAAGTTDVSGVVTGETATINANVADGVMTLSGLTADVALFDTLAEWIDAAELALAGADGTLAFEFDGDTYVVSNHYTANTNVDTTDTVIELTGVTGIDALSTSAAAATIQIA